MCRTHTLSLSKQLPFLPTPKGRLNPIFRRPFASLQNKSSHYPLPKRRLNQ
ncbi:MAG: hypothetical protein E6899_02810 [Neisseria sp.]|uniref:hypothetical protein n=1 Tax=Neisseria sp. HMSC074B07 TaxID=1715205 RepID=UPI00143B992E|nr:hypothetical protein [Neisseria sp. HMSC074B07]MDU1533794.1 hypothetical protein [Neisseria sp.]